jgi:hypothetical protein
MKWPQTDHFIPVCQPAQWQRLPMRVTLKPTGGEAATYDVVGTASILEEGDNRRKTDRFGAVLREDFNRGSRG